MRTAQSQRRARNKNLAAAINGAVPRKRGRPKGSKNAIQMPTAAEIETPKQPTWVDAAPTACEGTEHAYLNNSVHMDATTITAKLSAMDGRVIAGLRKASPPLLSEMCRQYHGGAHALDLAEKLQEAGVCSWSRTTMLARRLIELFGGPVLPRVENVETTPEIPPEVQGVSPYHETYSPTPEVTQTVPLEDADPWAPGLTPQTLPTLTADVDVDAEKQDTHAHDPLLNLLSLIKTQQERIAQFRKLEREQDTPIKELDAMVNSLRQAEADFVKIALQLKIFRPEDDITKITNVIFQHNELIMRDTERPSDVKQTISRFINALSSSNTPAIDV